VTGRHPLLGQTLDGRFTVEEMIRQGREGIWFRGRTEGRPVLIAWHSLLPEVDRAARLLSLAARVARMSCPHITPILGSGVSEYGEPYVVYDSDTSVLPLLPSDASVPALVDMAVALCSAVVHAHQEGFLIETLSQACMEQVPHDIAPGGVRIRIPSPPSPSGINVRPPECLGRGLSPDVRSEIWLLGDLLYRLFCGRASFEEDPVGWYRSVREDVPTAPKRLRENVPSEVSDLILRCLDKDPARRPQDVAEVCAALYPFRSQGNTWAVPLAPAPRQPVRAATDWDQVIALGEEPLMRPAPDRSALGLGFHDPANTLRQHRYNHAAAYYVRGALRYARKEYDAAQSDFSRAHDLDPCWQYTNAQVTCQLAVQDYAQALDTMHRARAAIKRATQGPAFDPMGAATSHYLEGLARHRCGDYRAAVEAFSLAISESAAVVLPSDITTQQLASYYAARSVSLHMLGLFKDAIADCTEAIHRSSQSAEYHWSRGVSFQAAGQLKKAIADYSTAMQLDPSRGEYVYCRGLAYHSQGKHARAEADFAAAAQLGYRSPRNT